MPTTPNIDKVFADGKFSVKWGTDDLGYTKGGIDVSIATTTHETTVDQFGSTVVNEFITGTSIEIKVPMAETDLDKFLVIFPDAVLSGVTNKRLIVKSGVGVNQRSRAKTLVLHSESAGVDKTNDIVVPLASCTGSFDFKVSFEDERVYMVTFKGYPTSADTGAGATLIPAGTLYYFGYATTT